MTAQEAEVETGLVVHEKSGFWMRPGTLDDYVIGERKQYLALGPREDDVLLDIGANIGSVARTFLEKGIRHVRCYEPDPDNWAVMCANLHEWMGTERVSGRQQAVIYDSAGYRLPLYKNRGRNKGAHSMTETIGRDVIQVECAGFRQVIGEVNPTLVKIDIEGGEYQFTEWIAGGWLANVRALAVEFHLTRAQWRQVDAPNLMEAIISAGFHPVKAPVIGEKNWTTLSVWSR